MDAPLSCPRCAAPLERFLRSAAPGESSVIADMCDHCGGMWLDGDEVVVVYPALAHLAERHDDLHAAKRAAGGIGACPRCRGVALEFPFFDLWLDHCARCHGLWIDGDELLALAATRDREDGLPPPAPAPEESGGYRTQAVSAALRGEVACSRCQATLALADTVLTRRGPMCATCAEAFAPRSDDVAEEPLEIPMTSMFSTEGLGASLRDVGALLLSLVDNVGGCPRCGSRDHRRCIR
jgi:Zn-finger nucleic acid-binding protein